MLTLNSFADLVVQGWQSIGLVGHGFVLSWVGFSNAEELVCKKRKVRDSRIHL
jgi:hypothetical protein